MKGKIKVDDRLRLEKINYCFLKSCRACLIYSIRDNS